MRPILRNCSVNLEVDAEVLQDLPYLNTKIKVGELNKAKQREPIFDVIIKQLPPNNDLHYIEHDRVTDTFKLKKDNKGSKGKASQAIQKKNKKKTERKMRQNKDKVKKTAKMAINELRKSKHIQVDDAQTDNYNNYINLDDVASDVEFIKQVPVHPRDRLAQNSKKISKKIKIACNDPTYNPTYF